MSGFGALLRRGSSQRGLVQPSEQETTSSSNSSSERGIGGLLRKAKSLRGFESSGSRRHVDQQQQDNEQEPGLGGRQNSSKSLLNSRVGIESSSSRRRLINRQGSDDEGPSGVASFLSQIEASDETTAKPGERPRQAVARAESQKLWQSSSNSSNGRIRGFFRKAASLGNMTRPKEEEVKDTNLQPVLVMTDENHGKVVFQHLEEDEDHVTSEELTTFEKHYNHLHHLGSSSCSNLHYRHYNSQSLMNASLPDLSSTSTGSSSNSSGEGSAPESPNKVQQQQQVLHSSFSTCRTSFSPHSSMRESLFVEAELFLDFSSSNLEDGNLEMRGPSEPSSKAEPKLPPRQGQGQEQRNQDLEGRPSLPSEEEPDSRSGRGLGCRLGALFRRTKSGRSITESEASATEAQISAAVSPTKKRKKNGLLSSLASEVSVNNNNDNDKSTSPDSPPRRRDTPAPFKYIKEISLPSLMDANDHEKYHQRRKADNVTEANDLMEGLMKVVEKYEDYQTRSRHFSSDEEDFQFQNDEENDDDDINQVDNINDNQENSFKEEEESDESEEHLEVEDEINDDPNFYEGQFDKEDWTPTPAQSQFDIEVAPNAGYGEKREYDDLELFYEEETFALVGGSMLLGQASELMTVLEYDEEDYGDCDEEDEDEGNHVTDTNGPSLATVDEMDESCNSACSGEW